MRTDVVPHAMQRLRRQTQTDLLDEAPGAVPPISNPVTTSSPSTTDPRSDVCHHSCDFKTTRGESDRRPLVKGTVQHFSFCEV